MKRLFCLLLALALLAGSGLLVSCSGEKQLAKGVSLEEAGYTVALPHQLTADLFGQEMSYEAMTYLQTFTMEDSYRPFSLEDGYTQLALFFFTPYSLGALSGPTVLWLQAFPRSQITRNTYLRIHGEEYPFSALEEHKVYEDRDVIILNLYDLVEDKEFAQVVQELVQAENEGLAKAAQAGLARHPEAEPLRIEDFQYLLDLNRYYQEELKNLIQKKD